MSNVFHEGELAVQQRAGVHAQAQRVGQIISNTLPDGADPFLERLPMLIAGGITRGITPGVDDEAGLWASVLTGEPSFVRAPDSHTVWIKSGLAEGQ